MNITPKRRENKRQVPETWLRESGIGTHPHLFFLYLLSWGQTYPEDRTVPSLLQAAGLRQDN